MASETILRELVADVIRIHRAVVIALMTLNAVCIRKVVIPADMTGLAGLCRMCALQWESGVVVIEGRRLPGVERVAGQTVVTELSRGMWRILR